MDDFDRKWKRIQDQLGAQIRGDEPARFSRVLQFDHTDSLAKPQVKRLFFCQIL